METGAIPNMQAQTEVVKRTSIAEVICEFLEVAFHLILYNRSLYPDGIFKKCRKYNVAVMMSCHPDLNNYLKDVMTGISSLISLGQVERVTLQIVSNDERPLERYIFELSIFQDAVGSKEIENASLEQQLRNLLLKILTSDAILKPLPTDCSFVVTVQTKESVANEFVHCEHFDGFPWVTSDDKDSIVSSVNPVIIPLKTCSNQHFDLQCFVEINVDVDK